MNLKWVVALLCACLSASASPRYWKRLALPVCGDLAAIEDTQPERVVRWLDAYFLELAAVFPESTRRLLSEVYFHGAYVHAIPSLASQRKVLATAELINTGTEVVPYVEMDKALLASSVLRRALLLQQVIGVLGPHHAHVAMVGVSAAYRDRDRYGLTMWTRLVGATVEMRLHAALSAVHWDEELATIEDTDVREVFEARQATLDNADAIDSLVRMPARRRGRRTRTARREVRVFESLLASAEDERPCLLPDHVEIPSAGAAKLAVPRLAPTELPTVAPRTALEAVRRR